MKPATGKSSATSSTWWAIYASLLCLRLLCTLLPGYVHPDEFFQGGQELFFGCRHNNVNGNSSHPPGSYYPSSFSPTGSLTTTWEFEPRNAIRSIVPPMFMTLLPLKIYAISRQIVERFIACIITTGDCSIGTKIFDDNASINGNDKISWDKLSGFEIWIVPRLFLALVSTLAVDIPCRILAKRCSQARSPQIEKDRGGPTRSRPTELLIVASSWSALVFLCRPFTNMLETMVLSVLLVIISGDLIIIDGRQDGTDINRRDAIFGSITVGILSSIGIFVRFTFAFFALPAVAIFLVKKGRICHECTKQRNVNNLGRIVYHTLLASIGFVICSCAFVSIDTMFYSEMPSLATPDDKRPIIGGYYIAPINAFLYNSKVDNLGQHGLHPRITHLAVNLPMLFGPLAFFFYADIANIIIGLLKYGRKMLFRGKDVIGDSIATCTVKVMCRLVILCGIFVLSCAPHQEPRFLLPTAVPLIALYGHHLSKGSGRYLLSWLWVGCNILLLLFFGLLHQAGVVPSLLASGDVISDTNVGNGVGSGAVAVYYHTYMPPSFMSRPKHVESRYHEKDSCSAGDIRDQGTSCSASTHGISALCGGYEILDLKGSGRTTLRETIEEHLDCSPKGIRKQVLVVAPLSVWDVTVLGKGYRSHSLYSYRPHMTTEDMPIWRGNLMDYARNMKLSTYAIKCD